MWETTLAVEEVSGLGPQKKQRSSSAGRVHRNKTRKVNEKTLFLAFIMTTDGVKNSAHYTELHSDSTIRAGRMDRFSFSPCVLTKFYKLQEDPRHFI
jgi:hypothetical protein